MPDHEMLLEFNEGNDSSENHIAEAALCFNNLDL